MATHSSPNFHSFKEKSSARRARRIVAAFLIFSAVLTSAYTALSLYISTQLVYAPQQPLYATPALFGMQFHRITFPSRVDHVQLRGWFIPGVLPGGHLTAQRTIIMVHAIAPIARIKGQGCSSSAWLLPSMVSPCLPSICEGQVNRLPLRSRLAILNNAMCSVRSTSCGQARRPIQNLVALT